MLRKLKQTDVIRWNVINLVHKMNITYREQQKYEKWLLSLYEKVRRQSQPYISMNIQMIVVFLLCLISKL